jgi:hypothetical protein
LITSIARQEEPAKSWAQLISIDTNQRLMSSETELTTSDQGLDVVTQENEIVGEVVEVRENHAYVKPEDSVSESTLTGLGLSRHDEDTYELGFGQVGAVVKDQVRLER